MKKYQIYLILILILSVPSVSGCDSMKTSTSDYTTLEPTEQSQLSTPDYVLTENQEMEPTLTPIPQSTNKFEIISLHLKYGALCPGAQSNISYSISNPQNKKLDINWSTYHGKILEKGDETIYTAPTKIPADGFDVIELSITDGNKIIQESMRVLIINHEDTQSWQPTGGPYGGNVSSIAINQTNPDVLYAGAGDYVYKSIDAGETWLSSEPFPNPGGSSTQIFLNQDNPEILYALKGKVYKSTDAGNEFSTIFIAPTHVSTLEMSSFDPDLLLAGTGGGKVFITSNGGGNWGMLNFPYLSNESINSIGISSDVEFWIGTRDWSEEGDGHLYHSIDKGHTWSVVNNINQPLDTFIQTILVDPIYPQNIYVSFSQSFNARLEDPSRVVFWSSNSGTTWKSIPIPNVWDSSVFVSGLSDHNRTLYISHASVLYKMTRNGKYIEEINLPVSVGDIDNITIDSRDIKVIYFPAEYGSGVLKTTDGGESFSWKINGILNTAMSLIATGSRIGNGTIYATSSGGEGLFRSFDYGEHWENLLDNGIAHPWADEIQLNPHDPDEIWYMADLGLTQISNDQGENWDTIFLGCEKGFRYSSVYALAFSPSNPDVLYSLKSGVGIYKHDNWRLNPHEPKFLRSSEVDYSVSLSVHPEDENIIVSGYIPKPFQDFAFVRASWDGGDNWETIRFIEKSEGVTSVVFSPAMPDRLYFGSIGPNSSIFRSDNLRGGSLPLPTPWPRTNSKTPDIEYIEIVPHPTYPDTVYVSAYPSGVYKSEDAGESWIKMDNGLPKYEVQDGIRQGRYNLTISKSNPEILYVGIFGEGVFISKDGGRSWKETTATEDLDILALSIDPLDSDTVYVGTEHGLIYSENGGESWSSPFSDLKDIPIRTLAWSGSEYFIAGTMGYEIFHFSRGSDRWYQEMDLGIFGVKWPMWNDRPLYQYTSLIFHPEDPNKIIFGTFPTGIFISENRGLTLYESNIGWTWDGVFTLAFHPENSDILFAGTYNGVNRSTDGGESWEMWDTGWPDEQWVFSIDFDPRDPDVMYACSKNGENEGQGQPGFFMGTVMKSTNGGETWFNITHGLPMDQEYYKIIVDPYSPDVLYLASSREGVYISYDSGETWQNWNEGLTNKTAGTNGNNVTNTMELSPDGLHLYFGTAGSGVFRRMTVNASNLCGCDQ